MKKGAQLVRKGGKNPNCNVMMVVVVVLILFGLFFLCRSNGVLGNNREGFEGSVNTLTEKPNPKENEVYLVLFFVDWCPHCKTVKPEWEKLKAESNLGVQLEEVDCSDSNNVPALAKEYNVGGFPTLILVNGGNKVTYEGERTAEALVSFIKENH